MLLEDDSRFAAADAARSDGNRTAMRRAVYSPCDVCAEDPDAQPLWQLKADRVVHDQDAADVIYHHAFLEIFGVPIFYTPFFTHPDPSVERRSGFLAPDFGFDDQDGFRFSVPYYWTISPDFDVTVAPIILATTGAILNGEIRKRWSFGEIEIAGGGGWLPNDKDESDGREMRGHVFAKGAAALSENWRLRGEIERASDDTYLRRYDIADATRLDSEIAVERFGERSYAALGAQAFQGLRSADIQDEAPLVLPEFEAETFADLGDTAPGRIRLAARGFAIERDDGVDSARASVSVDWRAPFLLPLGQEATVSAEMRADGFLIGNFADRGQDDIGTEGRL
ncbi:MAG: LPS assembly protein LptD, partial [Pseudomonadota bacterium]